MERAEQRSFTTAYFDPTREQDEALGGRRVAVKSTKQLITVFHAIMKNLSRSHSQFTRKMFISLLVSGPRHVVSFCQFRVPECGLELDHIIVRGYR